MQIRDINKPVNSKTLNETMAKKYGTKIDVDSFTLEQLQDARNKIRSKVFDIETNESFGGISQNKTYSKNKLFLDVLNAAISERADIQEGEVPAGLKAYQDKQKGKSSDKEDKKAKTEVKTEKKADAKATCTKTEKKAECTKAEKKAECAKTEKKACCSSKTTAAKKK